MGSEYKTKVYKYFNTEISEALMIVSTEITENLGLQLRNTSVTNLFGLC